MLDKKDIKINYLSSVLKKKDEIIRNRNWLLKNKDELLRYKEWLLEKNRGQILSLQTKLQAIERSFTWQSVMRLQSFIDKILPEGSRMRSLYDSIIQSNRTLFKEKSLKTMGSLQDSLVDEDNKKRKEIFSMSKDSKYRNIETKLIKSTNGSFERFQGGFPHYKSPLVSIIMLTFNGLEFTHQCLDSILKYADVPYELLIIDNASRDGTREFLKRLENVKITYNNENVGFGEGCNQGARSAISKYLLFLNNDTIVTGGWLSALVETAESNSDMGAVGSKILFLNGLIQEAGGVILKSGVCKTPGRGDYPFEDKYLYLREVDHCSATCLLVARNLFEDIGGFDKRYSPAYYEDIDLSMAIRDRGYKILLQPNSVIYHNEHTSMSEVHRKKLMKRNRGLFKKKWERELASIAKGKP